MMTQKKVRLMSLDSESDNDKDNDESLTNDLLKAKKVF